MVGKKYIHFFYYHYKRFHIKFNKKIDKYYHVTDTNIIIDMSPYDYKSIRKAYRRHYRRANDHWTNFLYYVITALIVVILTIVIHYLTS